MKISKEMYQLKLKDQESKSSEEGAKKKDQWGDFLDSLRGRAVSFWVDSSGGPKEHCNLSFWGVEPKYYFWGSLNQVFFSCLSSQPLNINCFDFIEKKLKEEKHNKDGVFIGYFSYDLIKNESHAPISTHSCTHNYPDFFFAYFDRVEKLVPLAINSPSLYNEMNTLKLCSSMTDDEFLRKVRMIKGEIKAGNVYQVNLTREYFVELDGLGELDELGLYLRLRKVSPNPYGCFFKTPFLTILSSSPEEFLYLKGNLIKTRPIKGTMTKNIIEIDPKNQAENIMIVDLERNDLGRICEYGSIKAEELLEIEPYEHLNQVVSTVEGVLKPNISLREIFEATFPGGSITGAPKIAAMKLIDELEPVKRGAYTGSFGYIKTDGTMNFNILIRTMFLNPRSTILSFNVGGGIVADSDPQGELDEIKLKAKGIMDALRINL